MKDLTVSHHRSPRRHDFARAKANARSATYSAWPERRGVCATVKAWGLGPTKSQPLSARVLTLDRSNRALSATHESRITTHQSRLPKCHTMQSNFPRISLKTKAAHPHKVSQTFEAGRHKVPPVNPSIPLKTKPRHTLRSTQDFAVPSGTDTPARTEVAAATERVCAGLNRAAVKAWGLGPTTSQNPGISIRHSRRIEIAVTHSKQTIGAHSIRHKTGGAPKRQINERRGGSGAWRVLDVQRVRLVRFAAVVAHGPLAQAASLVVLGTEGLLTLDALFVRWARAT